MQVTALMRRILSALLLAIVMGAAGALGAGSASAAPRTAFADNPGSSTPSGDPGASVGVLGEHFVKFCVKNFKPGTTVKVVNTTTGATTTLHVSQDGKGCTNVPIKRACHAVTQTIVATGTGANGKPATVKQTVTAPATKSLCGEGVLGSGSLPFTGSDIIIPGVIIGLVLIATGTALTIVRRRRSGEAAAA
jgi:hypothetical protein